MSGLSEASLRRVATLVARGVSQDDLFAAVSREIALLVGADPTSLTRFEPGDTVTLVAAWSAQGDDGFPIGSSRPIDDELRAVRDDGRVLRWGPAELPSAGPFVEEALALGVRSAVGVPIVVEGRVWGVAFAASSGDAPLVEDAEERIAEFTELMAIAIANLQARADVQMLVDEQRALRSLALLVARGAPSADVFDAVVAEAARLLERESASLHRFDDDGFSTLVSAQGGLAPIGMRIPVDSETVTGLVWRTGRAARVDSYDGVRGAATAHTQGLRAAVGAPIVVDGRLWGLIAVVTRDRPLPAGTEHRLAQFAELVATSIGSAESRAKLTASRARVVATADETRRRIERDVHDGAQQRLVHTVIALKLAKRALGDADGPVAELVDDALENAQRATDELRDLVQGILPASLGRGLRAAVESLVASVGLPVAVDVPEARLPRALETTAFFVVAEALTNVVKHAGATGARVEAAIGEGELRLVISDDGKGGADRTKGTGLLGLDDRVAACGGRLTITSPPGDGTTLLAELPITSPRHGQS